MLFAVENAIILPRHSEIPRKRGAGRKKARGSAFERLPIGASNCHSPMSER